jgi:hypothetical protein
MAHQCEGACEEHAGPLRLVRVKDMRTGHDWGNFLYCEAAIQEDIARGLAILAPEANTSEDNFDG